MKEKIFYAAMYLRLSRDDAADGGSAKESGGRVDEILYRQHNRAGPHIC